MKLFFFYKQSNIIYYYSYNSYLIVNVENQFYSIVFLIDIVFLPTKTCQTQQMTIFLVLKLLSIASVCLLI